MAETQSTPLVTWLLKQAPVIVLLVGTNIAQYNYFTTNMTIQKQDYSKQIDKLETKIDILQNEIISLHSK